MLTGSNGPVFPQKQISRINTQTEKMVNYINQLSLLVRVETLDNYKFVECDCTEIANNADKPGAQVTVSIPVWDY